MDNKRLRPGDEVLVIAGNDKGRTGKIISRTESRVVVDGINIRKKHMKKSQQNQKGQIIDIELPVHISNVRACVDGKPCKLRARMNKKGEKEIYVFQEKKEVLYRPKKQMKS
jgi:large subunit ribosomal protein L24